MSSEDGQDANLSALLAALAVGARAVHGLPLGDDFDYEATFPEFQALVSEGRGDLRHVLSLTLQEDLDQNDPAVWEACADACDWLIEQAEIYLTSGHEKLELTHWSQTARQQAQSAYSRMMEGLVDMEKPQITYNIRVDNGRTTPFIPMGCSQTSLSPGRANDTRFGGTPDVSFLGKDFVGPSHFVPHQKRQDILALKCTYKPPTAMPAPIQIVDLASAEHVWVSSLEVLASLVKKLEAVNIFAVDLEAHSHRSFAGMTCLMQITIPNGNGVQDYLIDTLALWHDIHSHLAPIFADPSILKVMHGADSDVAWLQRDFGIYIVNLLDTGRAARLMNLPSFGLAHLLKHYVGIDVDKAHQLSDWRQRPLPQEMKLYAQSDTHYLLGIAERLLFDISQHSSPEVTIETLFEACNQVCLIRYDKEIFRVNGYKSLINAKRKAKTELLETQEDVLASLYEWRDLVARDCDESPQYVCHNKALLRLAMACPTTVTSLQSLLNPVPPLVLRFAQDVLERISNVMKEALGPPSSAFFKPAEPEEDAPAPRGILSPVLGTEALYKQAGWMTPSTHDAIDASVEEDDTVDENQKKLLLVDDANKEYHSSGFTSHSLAMGASTFRGKTADGLGAASGLSDEVEQAAERAQRSASNVRKVMGKTNILGLIAPVSDVDDEDEDDEDDRDDDEEDKENEESDNEIEIPMSMREIYKLSNRNRRNKSSSGTAEKTVEVEMDEGIKKPVDTLEGAEAVIAARGSVYFDDSSKRQKQDEDEPEERATQEEDIAFMQQIGWIKNKEEGESLKPRPREDSEEFDVDDERSVKDGVKPFDYSSVGNVGVYDPNTPPAANPFFSGAAVSGGAFSQGSSGSRRDKAKKGGNKSRPGRGGRQQERPEKKEGKTFVYKTK